MEHNSFIGVGSNIDDKLVYINSAIEQINKCSDCKVVKVSSVYETKPYGNVNQDNFLNCVLKLKTSLTLDKLFILTKKIEKKLGRKTREKWGPREIDLDILFYNDVVYSGEKLNVPHEDVLNRDFVLVPLAEIEPDLVHPVIQKKIAEISLSNLGNNIIRKLEYQFT